MSPARQGPGKHLKGHGKGGDHPRKDAQGRFITDRDGKEICYKFANGGQGACPEPCAQGRAHVCQKCLQPHRNGSTSCPKREY
eukprot:5616588-Karenia_brevis.AAC.1